MTTPAEEAAAEPVDVLLRARPGLLGQEVDGETVVYEPVTRQLYVLDPPATAVWQRIGETGVALTELCESLATSYDVELARIAEDLRPLLDRLVTDGIVEAEPVAARP